MSDVKKTPYAEWLEGMIRQIMEVKPVRMGIVMVAEDGVVLTGYYGDRSHQDIAAMAWHLNMDAIWETVSVNADKLLIMGQDLMESEEDDGDDA